MEDKETRELTCEFCLSVFGSVSMPLNTSEQKWTTALSAYRCSCQPEPVE